MGVLDVIQRSTERNLIWETKCTELEDPLYDILLHLTIHGHLKYSITDSRKLLFELSKIDNEFTEALLVSMLREIVEKQVRDFVVSLINVAKVSCFEIDKYLMEINEVLQNTIGEKMEKYGIEINSFGVDNISVPKEDYETLRNATERASIRRINHCTWLEEHQNMMTEQSYESENIAKKSNVIGSDVSDINPRKKEVYLTDSSATDQNYFISKTNQNNEAINDQFVTPERSRNDKRKLFCVECGQPLNQSTRFCPECGRKVEKECLF